MVRLLVTRDQRREATEIAEQIETLSGGRLLVDSIEVLPSAPPDTPLPVRPVIDRVPAPHTPTPGQARVLYSLAKGVRADELDPKKYSRAARHVAQFLQDIGRPVARLEINRHLRYSGRSTVANALTELGDLIAKSRPR